MSQGAGLLFEYVKPRGLRNHYLGRYSSHFFLSEVDAGLSCGGQCALLLQFQLAKTACVYLALYSHDTRLCIGYALSCGLCVCVFFF